METAAAQMKTTEWGRGTLMVQQGSFCLLRGDHFLLALGTKR
jgi:hypothetical protein